MYYYVYNLQGDVTHIIDANKNIVGTYQYDAWGKILNLSSLTAIAQANPFRYRGYYYDNESGLYYLNSRYYNAEWGRFINVDSAISGVGGDIRGYNLFAYCMNNPVNFSDESGNWPKWIKEIGNRIAHTAKFIVKTFTAPLKVTTVEIGWGIGFGVSTSGNIKGLNVEVEALWAITDSLSITKGQFDAKSTTVESIGVKVADFALFQYSEGVEHSLLDDTCTCDILNDPYANRAKCPANKPIEAIKNTIDFSFGAYCIFGLTVSASIDINDLNEEYINIFNEVSNYKGYY